MHAPLTPAAGPVRVRGRVLHREVTGSGDPVLLLHGGFCSLEHLRPLAGALARRFTVVTHERPGHGRSPDVEGPYGVEDSAEEALAVLDAHGVGAARVVGFSDGANAGLVLALRHPERVRSLVMISGNLSPDGFGTPPEEWGEGPTVDDDARRAHVELSPDPPEHADVVLAKLWRLWATEPRLDPADLAGVAAPVLVVAGEHDAVRQDHSALIAASLPAGRLLLVPGATHDLVTEHPAVVEAAVLEHLLGTAPDPPPEEVLTGGLSTLVARRGDAVHRTAGPWTPTVHRLLRHLAAHGVDFLPRPLGYDERGREVLTHLTGAVPRYPLPASVWTPEVLVTAGRQLARVHAASRGFPAVDPVTGARAVWQQPAREPAEVVCLNDVAPYNMVFDDDGALVGWIDVDTASPGPRVWDLAHLAHRLVPLTSADDAGAGPLDLERCRQRLADLCAAYADDGDGVLVTPAQVLASVADRLGALADDADARAAAGDAARAGHGDFYRAEAAWLARHRRTLGGGRP